LYCVICVTEVGDLLLRWVRFSLFVQDTNKVLAISRILVAWQPVGLAVGVYDMVLRYTKERKQFNAPIAAFQVSPVQSCSVSP